MTPSVSVTKNPFALPATSPAPDGVLAIVASSQSGVVGQVASFANPNLLLTAKGYGPCSEYGAYNMNVCGNSVVTLTPTTSVAATYGTIVKVGTGTFTATATASTYPLEHYGVLITFLTGATLGSAGATYTYSLDGGNTNSAVQSLGTALVIAPPNTGVSVTLSTTGTSTIVAGDTIAFPTERALMNDTDIATAMGQLNLSRLAYEMVLLDTNIGAATIGVVDTILSGWEANGLFKIALMNTRFKTEPSPATETEAAYLTAMTTLVGSQTSERCVVGGDGAHVPSTLTGFNLKRPTALLIAAAAMALTPNIGIDPAYVGNGPVVGAVIADGNSNPGDHDEALYPGLDALGLSALRSFAPGGPQGVYINNANIISPSNSNIRFLQQLRVLNKACTIAWQILTGQLSLGVRTQINSNTGALNIAEIDAIKIEQLVNPSLKSTLKGQLTNAAFLMNRDDDLTANPVSVGGQVAVVGLVYIKKIKVVVAFSKTIAANSNP
jgi:hypothetical protein